MVGATLLRSDFSQAMNLTMFFWLKSENARLRKELRDTKDALEILKKAISILGN